MHGAHSKEERSKNTFTYCTTNVVSVDRLLAAATTSLAALLFRHDDCIVWIAFAFDDATKNEKTFVFFEQIVHCSCNGNVRVVLCTRFLVKSSYILFARLKCMDSSDLVDARWADFLE